MMESSNNYFQMMLELRQNIDWINKVLKGGIQDTIIVDGVEKPSISKDIEDRWFAIRAMVEGRAAYESKAQLPASPPNGVVLAEVWKDSVNDNNGLYGWTGTQWEKSPWDIVKGVQDTMDLMRSNMYLVGQNTVINSAFKKDPIGSKDVPHGYTTAKSGVSGVIYPATEVVRFPNTEIGTSNAWKQTHYNNGVNKTDMQLYQQFNIPDALLGRDDVKTRFSFWVYLGDAAMEVGSYYYLLNSNGDSVYSGYALKVHSDLAVGRWGLVAFDALINNTDAVEIRICSRLQANGLISQNDCYVTGSTFNFDNFYLLNYDRNYSEETSEAIDSKLSKTTVFEPWKSGDNLTLNALFDVDAIGTSQNITGWDVIYGGVGAVQAPYETINKVSPVGNTAIKSTHHFDGDYNSDVQCRQLCDMPESYGETGEAKLRVVTYCYLQSANINLSCHYEVLNKSGTQIAFGEMGRSSDGDIYGQWFSSYFDLKITHPDAYQVRFMIRIRGTRQAVFSNEVAYLTGVYSGWTDKTFYDVNFDERVRRSVGESAFEPWKLHDNALVNSLFDTDLIGTSDEITGWDMISGGSNATKASYETVYKSSPVGETCLKTNHYFDGLKNTDIQPTQTVAIPEHLHGNVDAVGRYVVYVYLDGNHFQSVRAYADYLDESGSSIEFTEVSRVSASDIVGVWYPVIFDYKVKHANARTIKFRIRLSAQRGTLFVDDYIYITGAYLGWQRQDKSTYDFNLNDVVSREVNKRLNEALTPEREQLLIDDVYSDATGVINKALPSEIIQCWGDSLTDANYAAILSERFGGSRTVLNQGIGGENSEQIKNRVLGYHWFDDGNSLVPGQTVRLFARRTVPPRLVNESYRGAWQKYGKTIDEVVKVQFFINRQLIGTSYDRLEVGCTFNGVTVQASGHPFKLDDEVHFRDDTLPSNMYRYKTYFVKNPQANSFELTEFKGGASIDFSVGTGKALGDFYLDWLADTSEKNVTVRTFTERDSDTVIYWSGTNKPANIESYISDAVTVVNHLKTFAKRVFLIGGLPTDNDIIGTDGYTLLKQQHEYLEREFPGMVIDAWEYLRSKYDPNDQQDVTDYNNGITPSSLRVDGVHLNSAGNNHLVDEIYRHFVNKRW